MNKFIYALIGVTSLIVLIVIFKPHTNPKQSAGANTPSTQEATLQQSKTDLIIGNTNAKAIIIEYGDFKCPSCNQFLHQTEVQLRSNYIDNGKLKIIFRNLPYLGPDSQLAAEGSYCANDQQKFREYHDAVYDYMWDTYYIKGNTSAEFQDILTTSKLVDLANSGGLDSSIFQKCLESHTHKTDVAADLKASEAAQATGTPFFTINNQTVVGPQPYNVFKTLVDLQLR